MKKSIFILSLFLFSLSAYTQITGTNERFTGISTFDGKVVFVKEIRLNSTSADKNYTALKDWAKNNYAKDHFNSSFSYDDKNHRITVRSRIELLLPEKVAGKRDEVIMKFRIDSYIKNNICVVEITDINYLNARKENVNTLPEKVKAENMVTDKAIEINDANRETRINTRKGTIYYFNDLIDSVQKALNE